MRQAAEDALSESDLVALVLDAARKPRPEGPSCTHQAGTAQTGNFGFE